MGPADADWMTTWRSFHCKGDAARVLVAVVTAAASKLPSFQGEPGSVGGGVGRSSSP